MYLEEADDVGVLQQLHDLHLSEDLFQVLIIQLGLIHYFYSHLKTERRREKKGTEGEEVIVKDKRIREIEREWVKQWRRERGD